MTDLTVKVRWSETHVFVSDVVVDENEFVEWFNESAKPEDRITSLDDESVQQSDIHNFLTEEGVDYGSRWWDSDKDYAEAGDWVGTTDRDVEDIEFPDRMEAP